MAQRGSRARVVGRPDGRSSGRSALLVVSVLLFFGLTSCAMSAPSLGGARGDPAPALGPDSGTAPGNPANTYSVTFWEVGLPANTVWGVTLGATELTSRGDFVTFQNWSEGLVGFSVAVPSGYQAGPSQANLTVTSDLKVPILFQRSSSGGGPLPFPALPSSEVDVIIAILITGAVGVAVSELYGRRRRARARPPG
jgi:hypothetical protein